MTTITRAKRGVAANPFGRFVGTKMELLQAGAAVRSWDYRRASKDDHKLAKSVDDQGVENSRNEERLGWTHTRTFQDNDQGASRQARRRGVVREEFGNMLSAIRNGEPGDVLVMWELSRRERDLAVFVEVRDLCIEYGPYFWLVGGELYDVRNRHDRANLGMQAQQAESGADAIEEGVRRGLAANAEQGKPHGPVAFGYRRIYHPRTRKYIEQVLDLETSYVDDDGVVVQRLDADGDPWSPAGIVKGMYDDALACVPLHVIARELNRRRIPTPRQVAAAERATPLGPERWKDLQWETQLVRQILLNPANIGLRVSNGDVAKAEAWPPLVEPELFYALTNQLLDPARRTNPYVGVKNTALYLLTQLARCWVCKGVVNHHLTRSNGTHRYVCENTCATIPMELTDETVEAAVIYRLSDHGELSALLALDTNAPEIQAARGEVERLRADLADTKRRLRIAATEDMDDLEFRRADQRRRLAAAEARMTSTDLPAELGQFVGSDAEEAEGMWRGFALPVQRMIIRTVVDVWIFPVGKGRRNVPLEQRLFIESAARHGESSAPAWAARSAAARDEWLNSPRPPRVRPSRAKAARVAVSSP